MSESLIRKATCDYCSRERVKTRSSPYMAEIRDNVRVCRVCWDGLRERGRKLEEIDIGPFKDGRTRRAAGAGGVSMSDDVPYQLFERWFEFRAGFTYAEWASQQGTASPVSAREAWRQGYLVGRGDDPTYRLQMLDANDEPVGEAQVTAQPGAIGALARGLRDPRVVRLVAESAPGSGEEWTLAPIERAREDRT